MHEGGQHAAHRIAVEDALVDPGRPLVRVDLEDVGDARQMLRARAGTRVGAGRSKTSTRSGAPLPRRPGQVRRRRSGRPGGWRRDTPERPVPDAGQAEITTLCVRANAVSAAAGPDMSISARVPVVSICWSVTTTATLASARVRPLPARASAPEHAGEVLAAVDLGPRGHDVEHPPDAARLPGMREIDADAPEPRVGLDQRRAARPGRSRASGRRVACARRRPRPRRRTTRSRVASLPVTSGEIVPPATRSRQWTTGRDAFGEERPYNDGMAGDSAGTLAARLRDRLDLRELGDRCRRASSVASTPTPPTRKSKVC